MRKIVFLFALQALCYDSFIEQGFFCQERGMHMDKLIMVIVILIVLAALALIAWQIFSTANPRPVDSSGNVLLLDLLNTVQRRGGTIASNAPVVYIQIPGEKKAKMVQLKYARTVIGSGDFCDIVLKHPSVSRRHAEIYLAVRRQYLFWGKEARFFALKNISRTNPVEFYDPGSDRETPFKMITKSVPLKEEENFFYLGDIKVKVVNTWKRAEYADIRDRDRQSGRMQDWDAKGKGTKSISISDRDRKEDEIIRKEYEKKLKRSKATQRLL